jgi:hypothetical protein
VSAGFLSTTRLEGRHVVSYVALFTIREIDEKDWWAGYILYGKSP